jgi:hypothetical protein
MFEFILAVLAFAGASAIERQDTRERSKKLLEPHTAKTKARGTLFHGTSPEGIRRIWHEGFKSTEGREQKYTLASALAAFEEGGHLDALYKKLIEQDEDYDTWDEVVMIDFTEDAGTPMSGFTYFARDIQEVMTRGKEISSNGTGTEYALEVLPARQMVPDEDWLGSILSKWRLSNRWQTQAIQEDLKRTRSIRGAYDTYTVGNVRELDHLFLTLWNQLPDDMKINIDYAAEHHGSEDRWEWAALVGKDIIWFMLNQPGGPELLDQISDFASSVATNQPVELVQAWKAEGYRKIRHPKTGGYSYENDWQPIGLLRP